MTEEEGEGAPDASGVLSAMLLGWERLDVDEGENGDGQGARAPFLYPLPPPLTGSQCPIMLSIPDG